MAAGLIGGAALGAIASELLKQVIEVKEKISNTQPFLKRLESTLESIIPRLDAINRLNHNFETEQQNMQELNEIVNKGKLLVDKCSNVSSWSYIKKLRYGKELYDLDDSLKNYFIRLLPLEQLKNGLETLTLLKEIHTVIVSAPGESEAEQWWEDSVYEKKVGKKLFLLKGCPYHELDLKDLESCSVEVVSTGTYSTSHWYKTKYGDVLLKRLNLEVKMQKNVFQQRMEDIGKLRHHPNIILPFGYFYSELEKFLLYGYAPAGSLEALFKAPMGHGTRKRPRFAAPELIRTKEATKESDVYSFGAMLLEMVPTYRMNMLWHTNVLKEQIQIMRIAWKCTEKDPARRPKMDQVRRLIQNTISQEKFLPNP